MSKQLKLSHSLVEKILEFLQSNDTECRNNMVSCQYLAAIIGYLVGQQQTSPEDRKEVISELTAFIEYVTNDVSEQVVRQQTPPAAPPVDPSKAFGIWRPGDP